MTDKESSNHKFENIKKNNMFRVMLQGRWGTEKFRFIVVRVWNDLAPDIL